MKVYSKIDSLPAFSKPVVTIGTFDGVHLGHRQIINQLVQEAASIGGETVIITFYPHPRKVIGNKTFVQLINTTDEKKYLLESLHVDHLVVVPFTPAFAAQTAKEYVEDFLIKRFRPHTLIIGYDHRFGNGREGNFKLLEDYSGKSHFQLIEIPQHLLHESAISSTRIRENLAAGKIEEANELLGYSYFFSGTVTEGNKIGRSLGYPTANLDVDDHEKLIPANGVYAVTALVVDKNPGEDKQKHWQDASSHLKGMMNIGVRPTVDGTSRVIEVNLFDFNEDIYGRQLQVHVKNYLRGEQRFSGLEALRQQLANDKVDALQALAF